MHSSPGRSLHGTGTSVDMLHCQPCPGLALLGMGVPRGGCCWGWLFTATGASRAGGPRASWRAQCCSCTHVLATAAQWHISVWLRKSAVPPPAPAAAGPFEVTLSLWFSCSYDRHPSSSQGKTVVSGGTVGAGSGGAHSTGSLFHGVPVSWGPCFMGCLFHRVPVSWSRAVCTLPGC